MGWPHDGRKDNANGSVMLNEAKSGRRACGSSWRRQQATKRGKRRGEEETNKKKYKKDNKAHTKKDPQMDEGPIPAFESETVDIG